MADRAHQSELCRPVTQFSSPGSGNENLQPSSSMRVHCAGGSRSPRSDWSDNTRPHCPRWSADIDHLRHAALERRRDTPLHFHAGDLGVGLRNTAFPCSEQARVGALQRQEWDVERHPLRRRRGKRLEHHHQRKRWAVHRISSAILHPRDRPGSRGESSARNLGHPKHLRHCRCGILVPADD